jgi:hypothetical protein
LKQCNAACRASASMTTTPNYLQMCIQNCNKLYGGDTGGGGGGPNCSYDSNCTVN